MNQNQNHKKRASTLWLGLGFGWLCLGGPGLVGGAAPANDNFADRIPLAGAIVQTAGSNVGATQEPNEPYHWNNTGGKSVWWSWTAANTAPATISTHGSSFDTILAVYTGETLSSLQLVAQNDDAGGLAQSAVEFQAQAGTVYQIAVDGFGSGAAAAEGDILLSITNLAPDRVTLVASNSVWKYLDNGTDQGTAWRETGFDDSSWASGAAQLGYGDGDEATLVSFGPDPNNKYTTTYFRHAFSVANPASLASLTLRVQRDDAVVVYINGTEVLRDNLPAGPITFTTQATAAVGGDDEITWIEATVDPAVLVPGVNVIAAEIHQWGGTSSDISFNLELTGHLAAPNTPPTVSLTQPANGASFTAPATIVLQALASDAEGSVSRVEFFEADKSLATLTTPPYQFVWSNVFAGSYTLRAVATDNLGLSATSAPVTVTVSGNVPPTVALIQPVDGARFAIPANLTLVADASDPDGTIQRVEFYNASLKIGEALDRPYVFQWLNVSSGTYSLLAVATDNAGARATSAVVRVTVAPNQRPTASIASPTNGAAFFAPANITIVADAQDIDGTVTSVVFYQGSTRLGEDTTAPFSFDWLNVPEGSYTLRIIAADDKGATTTSLPVSITVLPSTNQPPQVVLISPPDQSVFIAPTNVLLEALAADNEGSVTLVEFYANDLKIGEATSSPFTLNWSNAVVGPFALWAVATDNTGLLATSMVVQVTFEGQGPVTLIPLGANWKYLDNGSDQGTAWREVAFDDSAWASGPAQLGYGDGDEATVVSFGPDANNKYPTTYFRHAFTVENPGAFSYLTLRVQRDDGVVVYLNGTEVFRDNMPDGPPAFNTYAVTAVGGADESTLLETSVSADLLRPGLNVVAVEIHQANPNSSDISFDLELIGNTGAIVNELPSVSLVSPGDNSAFGAPADIVLTASASDPDGSIRMVEFFANGAKIAELNTTPFTYTWSGVGLGQYLLQAVATDNLGGRATSAVVRVTVQASSAPTIAQVEPAPGAVTDLTQITVQFSEPVQGVDAADLLVNGHPARQVTGDGVTFTFTVDQPADGLVLVGWDARHGIRDHEKPPKAFDSYSAGATWAYLLTDQSPPLILEVEPAPGAVLRHLDSVKVTFTEAVQGVDAADLLINGQPAQRVSGHGAGPYRFDFASPANGTVTLSWAADHGITDQASQLNPLLATPWSYQLDTNAVFEGRIIFNEIMYHPASDQPSEEYVELYNMGDQPVRLLGWSLTRGVNFTFPDVTIPAHGFLVVAADVAAFRAKYPNVSNVVGNWRGRLSNAREEVELEDANGDRVDLVAYADRGDFGIRRPWPQDPRGWDWYADHDGLGKSLELLNPNLPNDAGQNWAASLANEGTPGAPNSVLTDDIPPMILDTAHFPPVPHSTNNVIISARIVDEQTNGLTVRLWYRDASSDPAPPFTQTPMFDDGAHNDGQAGDGVYAVVLPPQPNKTVVEFYVEAADATGHTRTWPAPAQQSGGGFAQVVNAHYQVDDEVYGGNQAVFRVIMTETERARLASGSRGSDAQMNATFISREEDRWQIRYNCGLRYRGAGSRGRNPPSYRLNIPTDRPWNGLTAINLNSQYTHAQVAGSAAALKAGLPTEIVRPIQLRVNGVNLANSGSPQFGSYVFEEPENDEWARTHYPLDPNGNVYRASSGGHRADLQYIGTNPADYIALGYSKTSNESENDWSDFIALVFALDPDTTPDSEYVQAVERVANVDLWLRYFAVLSLLEYSETSLGSGYGDDFGLYRGEKDPRFVLLAHDFDTVFGQGDTRGNPNENIFIAAQLPIVSRFLHNPSFEPRYYAEFRRQLAGAFSTNSLWPMFDQLLGGWVPQSVIEDMKRFVVQRNEGILRQLPPATEQPRATITGEPEALTYLDHATLLVGGEGISHYRYRLNNGPYSDPTPVAVPITLNNLADGIYSVAVIGRTTNGTWQSTAAPTLSRTWTVLTSARGVVINEILARNDEGVNHEGTYPDMIELYNAGNAPVNLSGMRLTDDLDAPDRFVFPAGTVLGPGEYLVLFANNPDGTSGLHVGFGLNDKGEALYLLDTPARGGRVLDQIKFGWQLPDLSIGRLDNGTWGLCVPSFGAPNTPATTGNRYTLRINEWLANTGPVYHDDFVELYNPDPLPVEIGGLYLTDNAIGWPFRHQIAPLSFIAGYGYRLFIADGNKSAGVDHLDFALAQEGGEIVLLDKDGFEIDHIVYSLQDPDISEGRSPNGAQRFVRLALPTPGVGNPAVRGETPASLVTLIPLDATFQWKYNDAGTDLGTAWRRTDYDDSSWPSGPPLLGAFRSGGSVPEPLRTQLSSAAGKTAFYFRARFNYDPALNASALQLTHIIDDGAVFYLNGQEVYRYNMPSGTITYGTRAANNILDATYQGPVTIPITALQPGQNLIAVEVHNASPNSPDMYLGVRLEAVVITNAAASGLVISEVMANNLSVTNADGSITDWVELYNPLDTPVDLADMSLTDRLTDPRRWVFPAGAVIPPQGYYVVRMDGGSPVSDVNTGFGLKATGDALYLFNSPANGGELLDAVTFGLQAPDFALGRDPANDTNWVLTLPTPGARNIPAVLGDPALLRINEWMANPASGDDWFEIYNAHPQPVALAGLYLTDDLNNRTKYLIPPLSFIGVGSHGYLVFQADNNPAAGPDHVNFRLSAGGESLGIFRPDGMPLDAISFGPQLEGVSEGRLPDGSDVVVSFATTPTPGDANFLPLSNVVINEVLSHSEPPLEDAIELHNLSASPVDIGGWYLSDSKYELRKFRIPDGTLLPAGGFKVFYEAQFGTGPLGFSLNSGRGDEVYLAQTDAAGNLTGFRAQVKFGPAENGVSFGRYVTSIGEAHFVAMSRRTFGMDNPDTVEEFRLGTGLPNAAPKVGPVVITEIMYHPPDLPDGSDNTADEYLELMNISSQPVPLYHPEYPTNTWRLRDAVKLDFPPNLILQPGQRMLVVGFDPAGDPAALAAFQSKYEVTPGTLVVGPWEGKLDNGSDSIELYKPDAPQVPPDPDAGHVPYVLVERVAYQDRFPWPAGADGTGFSLNRIRVDEYGDDPVNWAVAAPTPGPEGLLLRITRDAQGVRLQFQAQANLPYTIEYRDSLSTGAWQVWQNIPAGAAREISVAVPVTQPSRFYRVRTP